MSEGRLDALSNGLGGQSQMLLWMACNGQIPASLSIAADTGSEKHRMCSDGTRMTAREFFDEHVKPYGEKHGVECVFVRALDEHKKPMPDIDEVLRLSSKKSTFGEMVSGVAVPLFTNDKTRGRLMQSCTDKWKKRAIHQEGRRRGAKLMRNAIGFHSGEAGRIKSRYIGQDGGFSIYKPQAQRDDGELHDIAWLEHYHPLVDRGLNRSAIKEYLDSFGVKYLVTTECDKCPHQDFQRWSALPKEAIEEAAEIEAGWGGKLFFTPLRIPLKKAIETMGQIDRMKKAQMDIFPEFGCKGDGLCGI